MSLFIKNKETTINFLAEYSRMMKIQSPFVWEMPITKYFFYTFFLVSAVSIIFKTAQEKKFPVVEAKSVLIKLSIASLIFPAMICLDMLMNGVTAYITSAATNRAEKGKVAKYAAIELISTSNLDKAIKDSVIEKLHNTPLAWISHETAKKYVREETDKRKKSFIDSAGNYIVTSATDDLNNNILNSGVLNPYLGGEIENLGMGSFLNPINVFKDSLAAFVGYFNHLIRWVVLLVSQVVSMVILHLVIITLMLSFLPWFSGGMTELIKVFLALKFIPSILEVIDYVVDAMNIMNLSINAVGEGFVDAGSAAIGYSIIKIILTVSACYLSFMIYKAKANQFLAGSIAETAGKVGGAVNAAKNFSVEKLNQNSQRKED